MKKFFGRDVKLTIGFISAPLTSTTGYGKVCKEVSFGLSDMGYGVINIGGRGTSLALGEKFHAWSPGGNRVPVLPVWGQTGDRASIEHFIRRYDIDLIFSLYDAFVLSFGKPSKPWAAQIPIDTHLTKTWFKQVLNADYILAISQFGYDELLRFFPDFAVKKIPHGVDTGVFKPRREAEKREIRRRWKIPEDAYVMLYVAANWGERKCLPQLMITFKRFLEMHKDEKRPIILYLYTNLRGHCPQGYNLIEFAEELGIQQNVMGPAFNPMLDSVDDEKLAELYAAADVFVLPSLAEGFGLTTMESMSSGVSVIGTDYTSTHELVEGHGWLIETVPRDMWEDVPVWIPLGARYPVPNLNSLLECMNDAYLNPEKRKAYGKASRKFALKYSWKKILPLWESLIKEMSG